MSEYNTKTINMYNSGGAFEYIQHNEIDPETEKWDKLFNYIDIQLQKDKSKRIIEFGSGGGQLAFMLQSADYDVIATDTVDTFLNEQNRIGINKVKKYNFLLDDYNDVFDFKADLIVS